MNWQDINKVTVGSDALVMLEIIYIGAMYSLVSWDLSEVQAVTRPNCIGIEYTFIT